MMLVEGQGGEITLQHDRQTRGQTRLIVVLLQPVSLVYREGL